LFGYESDPEQEFFDKQISAWRKTVNSHQSPVIRWQMTEEVIFEKLLCTFLFWTQSEPFYGDPSHPEGFGANRAELMFLSADDL
jgi:hypothetical protein